MVGPQEPLAVSEGALVQDDGLGRPARSPVRRGKVVARGHGAAVVGPQDSLTVSQGALVQDDGLGDPARRTVANAEPACSRPERRVPPRRSRLSAAGRPD
jgi:hypothetical protein